MKEKRKKKTKAKQKTKQKKQIKGDGSHSERVIDKLLSQV